MITRTPDEGYERSRVRQPTDAVGTGGASVLLAMQRVVDSVRPKLMLNVGWFKCRDFHGRRQWCLLMDVNLDSRKLDDMEGVYIIWHGGPNSRVVRIGQGVIRDRLDDHCQNPEITNHEQEGLFVTWARVPMHQRDGVEAFLKERLDPLIGDRFPTAIPIPVNLPWKAEESLPR
jgi:hypothetical protein